MSSNFIGELRLVSFTVTPKGWTPCNGQIMAIQQNQALFSLFGTMYGGNGVQTFGLPNLQGRVAIHRSGSYAQGQVGGEASHTLQVAEIPTHTHQVVAANVTQTFADPTGNLFGKDASFYGTANATGILPADVSLTGGSQAHENRQPFLVMNWLVALTGIFPSRN